MRRGFDGQLPVKRVINVFGSRSKACDDSCLAATTAVDSCHIFNSTLCNIAAAVDMNIITTRTARLTYVVGLWLLCAGTAGFDRYG